MTCQTFFLQNRLLSIFFTVYCLFFLHSASGIVQEATFFSPSKKTNGTQADCQLYPNFSNYHLLTHYCTVCHYFFAFFKTRCALIHPTMAHLQNLAYEKNYLALEKSCCFSLLLHILRVSTRHNTTGNTSIAASSSID